MAYQKNVLAKATSGIPHFLKSSRWKPGKVLMGTIGTLSHHVGDLFLRVCWYYAKNDSHKHV